MTSLRSIGISLAITLSVGCSTGGSPFEPSPGAGGHEGTSGAGNVAGPTTAGTGGSGSDAASGPSTSGVGAGGATGETTSGGATNTNAGLPCAVQALLQAKCVSCHGSPPAGGAPMSLVTYDDLAAPSKGNPSITYAALAITRMKSTSAPMPPGGPAATAAEVEAMSAWVSAGLPKGQCQPNTEPGPFDGDSVCTSNVYWTQGNHGSSKMHPGRACIHCHTNEGGGDDDDDDFNGKDGDDDDDDDAPTFYAAGTVFTTGHEPDDCNGGPQGTTKTAIIEITDATGKVFKLTPNKVGNFYTKSTVAKPYKARVIFDGKERAMGASQTSGDCNSCHTQKGENGAPGRIVLP